LVDGAALNNIIDQASALKGIIADQTGVTANPADYVLLTDTSDSGNLRKALVSTLPGAGTVTTVSATALPTAIFGISVGTPTTTPAIALTTKVQGPGKFLAGPVSGAAATPTFRFINPADIAVDEVAIAATPLDWSLGISFTKSLTATWAPTFSNPTAGQTIRIMVANTGAFDINWPTGISGVYWPAGTAPTMTHGAGKHDLYTIHYSLGHYWGSFQQNFLAV
jgi:hypothetical protein